MNTVMYKIETYKGKNPAVEFAKQTDAKKFGAYKYGMTNYNKKNVNGWTIVRVAMNAIKRNSRKPKNTMSMANVPKNFVKDVKFKY